MKNIPQRSCRFVILVLHPCSDAQSVEPFFFVLQTRFAQVVHVMVRFTNLPCYEDIILTREEKILPRCVQIVFVQEGQVVDGRFFLVIFFFVEAVRHLSAVFPFAVVHTIGRVSSEEEMRMKVSCRHRSGTNAEAFNHVRAERRIHRAEIELILRMFVVDRDIS